MALDKKALDRWIQRLPEDEPIPGPCWEDELAKCPDCGAECTRGEIEYLGTCYTCSEEDEVV